MSKELTREDLDKIYYLFECCFPPPKEGEEYTEVELGHFNATLVGSPTMVIVGPMKEAVK